MKYVIGAALLALVTYLAIVGTATRMLLEASSDMPTTLPEATIGLVGVIPVSASFSVANLSWNNVVGANGYLVQYGTNAGQYSFTHFVRTNRDSLNLANGKSYYVQAISVNLVSSNFALLSGQSKRLFFSITTMGKATNVSTR